MIHRSPAQQLKAMLFKPLESAPAKGVCACVYCVVCTTLHHRPRFKTSCCCSTHSLQRSRGAKAEGGVSWIEMPSSIYQTPEQYWISTLSVLTQPYHVLPEMPSSRSICLLPSERERSRDTVRERFKDPHIPTNSNR